MKVVFDIQNGKISLEGEREDIVRTLELAKEIAPYVSQIQITTKEIEDPLVNKSDFQKPNSVTKDLLPKSMRQFARSLPLANTAERLAVLAYFANKIEGKPSFAPKEMDAWFTMCGFQKPNQMSVALFDGKRKYGYLQNVSRGSWKISQKGEELIVAKIKGLDD